MKVIFQADVRGQAKKGEMKEVSDGYARNYLLPRNLAVEANRDNMNALRLKEKARAAQEAKERALALENAKKLEGILVKIPAKAGANGLMIEKQKIVLSEPIKSFGSYDIKCKFGYTIDGVIHIIVVEEK